MGHSFVYLFSYSILFSKCSLLWTFVCLNGLGIIYGIFYNFFILAWRAAKNAYLNWLWIIITILFIYWSILLSVLILSLSSSQWQHEQQGGAVVLLWGSGAGGHDPRTDLLPEEILWSAGESYKILSGVPQHKRIKSDLPVLWIGCPIQQRWEELVVASPPVLFDLPQL